MSDLTHKLWCHIEGDKLVFQVFASTTTSVGKLKEMIKERKKNNTLRTVDASDLTLTKAGYIMMFK
jgi:hypothetical protein